MADAIRYPEPWAGRSVALIVEMEGLVDEATSRRKASI
jgi:hypothetical protein